MTNNQKKAFWLFVILIGQGKVNNKLSYNPPAVTGVSVTAGVMTNYVGSLAEETKGVWVNHVFMGSTKIATVSNNEVRYHFQDHLGSANVVTNSSGTVIELIEYKPFGGFARRDQFGTSNAAWYYFTGKPLDEESGLMFYGARYYSPKLGKFITPDSIVQSPGNPQTLNRYSYCNNNPINLIDPDGHSWKSFWKTLVGAVIGAIVGILSGNPWLGFSAYNAFTAAANGGNIAAAVGGALIGYFGGAFIGNAAGNFWGTLGGGALGGAAGAGIGGGNVGLGALAGLGGSWAGYATGAFTGLAGLGTIIGGGVGSEISGGSFLDGALGAMAYNIGYTIGSSFAPMASTSEIAEQSQSGDAVFFNDGRIDGTFGPISIAMAVLDPGPFSHTGIAVGGGKVADSHPKMMGDNDGPDVRDMKSYPAYKNAKAMRISGKGSTGKIAQSMALDMKEKGVGFRYLSPSPKILFSSDKSSYYCSQFTSQVYSTEQMSGTYGRAPNTQSWYMRK